MKLYALFEPLISYLVSCRLHVLHGEHVDRQDIHAHILREFTRIRKSAAHDEELTEAVEYMLIPVAFFVDNFIKEGPFPFASSWSDLGKSLYNELSGDEKFFDILDEVFADDTPQAKEKIRVFYLMIGSGFTGYMGRDPIQLEGVLSKCAQHIDIHSENDVLNHLFIPPSPDISIASERNPSILGLRILLFSIVLMGASLSYHATMYYKETDGLRTILENTTDIILKQASKDASNKDALLQISSSTEAKDSTKPAMKSTSSATK